MEIVGSCPRCQKEIDVPYFPRERTPRCSHCRGVIFIHATDDFLEKGTFDQCSLCGASHLYRQRDFNHRLGMGIVVVGVLFSYFTYGLSLLIATLVDWTLYRAVGEVVCCYQCHAVFRGFAKIAEVEPFNLVFHDFYRNRAPS